MRAMRMMRPGAALAAAALVALAPAPAQEPGSRQARDFVRSAAQSDQFEIMEATTVLAQSTDPRVRAFARRMIDDHARTSSDLAAAASRAGLSPPLKSLGGDQAEMLAALQSARGADFDRLYARQQVLSHHAALVTEQGYAARGDVPSLRQAAGSATPIITAHLSMAKQLKAGLGDS